MCHFLAEIDVTGKGFDVRDMGTLEKRDYWRTCAV
jgi:hypothetical protein